MAQQTLFKVGDIVRLKSGGPEMTIVEQPSLQMGYRCQWFAGKKLEFGFFPGQSLETAEVKK